MKKIHLFAASITLFIMHGCTKTQEAKVTKPANATSILTIERSSGLKTQAIPGSFATYQILNAENNKFARISNVSLSNGGTTQLADYDGTAHFKWRLTYVGNNLYKIMNLGSGKMLQSYNYNGTQIIIQNSANGSDSQLWVVTSSDGKKFRVFSKANGLAITGNGNNPGLLQSYTGKPSQLWGYNIIANDSYRDDAVVNFFHRKLPSQGSVAFDQGNSIPLTWGQNAGKVLWIAEDSFDGSHLKSETNGNLKCGFFQYNNSVLIQPSLTDWNPDNTPNITIANSVHRKPRQVFDNQPGTDWSWPGVGVEIGNKVYVYCGEGKDLGATNQSLYELTQGAGTLWSVKRTLPEGMSNQTDILYSMGMVKPGDGFVYSYGSKGVFFNASNVFVARYPENDPQNWSFWNGTNWSKTRTSDPKARVASGQQNITFAYFRGKYIMAQLDYGWFCDPNKHNIYISTSNSPLGPFTTPKQVFTIEDRYRNHIIKYYTPSLHPEFDNGKELLVAYSVNFNACATGDNCVNGEMLSEAYQIKGVRVPYSLIGL